MKINIELDTSNQDDLKYLLAMFQVQASKPTTEPVQAPKPTTEPVQAPKPTTEPAQTPKPNKAKKSAQASKKTEFTLEEVRAQIKAYRDVHGKEEALKILYDVGKASSMSEIDSENYSAVMEAAKID